MALPLVLLPGMKLLWRGEIISLRNGLSLVTRTLVIILYVTLHRLMGLKFVKEVGWSPLGIKTNKVSVVAAPKDPISKAFLTKCQRSSPTSFQNILKKMGWNPSGPGALYDFMDIRAS